MKHNISLQRLGYLFLCSIIYLISSHIIVMGQELPSQLQHEAERFKQKKLEASDQRGKLDSRIFDEIQRMRSASGLDDINQTNDYTVASSLGTDSHGNIHVIIRTTEVNSSLIAALIRMGFEIESSTEKLKITPNLHSISGWAPLNRIEKIAQLEQIFHIRPAEQPISLSGDIATEGDKILRADLARQSFNINGSGQKVGVISTGVDHLANSKFSQDLPSNIQIINNRFSGDEGTAMLEIIHDIAPGASLAFADRGNNETDFINNIIQLKNAGCTVICDDILYPLEPIYEDGAIAQTVNNVVNNDNIVYISAAGNQQLDHYEADFADNDNDGWHNFAVNDETINIQLSAGAEITAVLQWNNQFGKSGDDYDFYIYNEQLTLELASSTNTQDGNDDPVEKIVYKNTKTTATNIHICIKNFSGQTRNLSLYTFGSGVTPQQYVGNDGAIYGHAAAQNCLSVAAIDARDPGNNDIEPTSNQGPTRIYSYDANGSPTTFVDRPKPDHSSIDGVATKVGQLGYFANPFYGTSAAAAHTAGIAALLGEVAPDATPSQLLDIMSNTAIDLGNPGFDNVFGHGRVDAFDAVSYLISIAPNISVSPDSIAVILEKGTATTRQIVIGNSGGSNLNFRLTWETSSISKMIDNGTNKPVFLLDEQHPKSFPVNNILSIANVGSNSIPGLSLKKSTNQVDNELILYEGFEAGIMPPIGWKKIDGPSSPGGNLPAHWSIDSSYYTFSGTCSAVCNWGLNLDEWLITPGLDFSNISNPAMSFWWVSSYFWHVLPNNNGDLFVKVSVDDGRSWETLWTFGEIGVWDDFVWYYSIIDLSAYRGKSNVKIAFHVVASDNADIAIDEIAVFGETSAPGWIQIDPIFGTNAPGGSQVIEIKISTVIEQDTLAIGTYSGNITVSSNDWEQPAIHVPVNLQVINQADIRGNLKYYSAPATAIDNATLRLTGDANKSIVSGSNGNYEFLNLNEGSYSVIPEKSNDFRQAITPYDASLILQHNVGLISFTPYQKIAGDVTANGAVTSYDAALVLRHTVNQNAKFPIGKDWTFTLHDFKINDDNWNTAPQSRTYAPLKTDQLNQDYLGILYGDVSGNWANPDLPLAGVRTQISIKNMEPQSDGKLLLPVSIKFHDAAYSGVFKMQFDQHNLKFISCGKDSQTHNTAILESSTSSELIHVAFAMSEPLNDDELVIKFLFEKIGPDDISASNFNILEVIIDDKQCLTTETPKENNVKTPTSWQLGQNYPNPFNSVTLIDYAVPEAAHVKLMIYNLVGQKLITLVDGIKQPGHYRASWNGFDDRKRFVGSGVYIYKIHAGKFEATKKMVLLL